jgi:hypothetical protein
MFLATGAFGVRFFLSTACPDLLNLYRSIMASIGIFAKPYNWRIASLCLVGTSQPGRSSGGGEW